MAEEMQQDEGFQQFDGQNGNGDAAENTDPINAEEDEDEDDRKVFVGGLSWETKSDHIKEYFQKFGEVKSVNLKTDVVSKKSRGFGFVVFVSPESVDKVMAEKDHKLQGRSIDPKKANPRPINKKIFVGRLDPETTEASIKTYFEENFGPVEKIELPFDKTKDQRRAFVFVEFKKLAHFKKCLEQEKQKIGTQEVEVKKATPPGGGAPGRGGPRGGFGRGRGRGGYGGYGYDQGYGGYGGYDYGYGQGYGGYGYGGDYYGQGYGYGGWNGGYDQGYGGYGGYGQSNYGKAQKRGGAGGYHPYR